MAEINYRTEKCWKIPESKSFKAKLCGRRIEFNPMEVSYQDYNNIDNMFQRNSIDSGHVLKCYTCSTYDYTDGECMFSFRTPEDAKEHFRILSDLDVFV